MILRFNKKGKLTTYSKNGYYNGRDRKEKQVSESELNELVPDDWEGDWKEYRRHFKLVDGEIVFDEDFEPENEVE